MPDKDIHLLLVNDEHCCWMDVKFKIVHFAVI